MQQDMQSPQTYAPTPPSVMEKAANFWQASKDKYFWIWRRHPMFIVGMVVLIIMGLMAILAPFLWTVDPTAVDPPNRLAAPGDVITDEGVSRRAWFGTDFIGRDVYSRVVYGARISLAVGFAVGALTAISAAVLGLLAGYFGIVDLILMRIMDAIMSIPNILLAIALVSMVGGSVPIVIFAIWFVVFPRAVRVVRSSVLSLREEVYVEAARAIGAKTPRILIKHVFPGTVAPLIVTATLIVAGAILTEAILSFLGAGIDPETPAWGSMMADGRRTISKAIWVVGIPGGFLTLTVLAINIIGDNLRDMLDPKLSRSEG
jgi:peptide/nickel transport system permease protein